MKSSDQRYFHVRRTKRATNLYPEIDSLLANARRDASVVPLLNQAIEQSAHEFTHILLACGRTASAFRTAFRRGCARHNVVAANDLAPNEVLRTERFEGYSVMRLFKEQHKNVKLRAGKLFPHDYVIHDPQGIFWKRVIAGSLAGPHAERLGILSDLRDRCVKIIDVETPDGFVQAVLRYKQREFRGYANKATADMPEWDADKAEAVALKRYVELAKVADLTKDMNGPERRVWFEQRLVVCEAFVNGGDAREIRRAVFDPDTSKRHCTLSRLDDRIYHVERRLIEMALIPRHLLTIAR